MALLWFSYVAAAAYTTGWFRPEIVLPAAAVVVVAMSWSYPGRSPRAADEARPGLPAALGALFAVAVAVVWFLLNQPYVSERIRVDRDPDVYTLAALWLFDHASPMIPVPDLSGSGPGFGLIDGTLAPQGYHLVSGISAAVGWGFGEQAVFSGNLACGAAALLALYVLGRRLLGPLWALLPVLGLAGSLPMLEFSRALYSEPLAMTFTFLGTTLLWDAWKRDRVPGYLLAGAAFGGAGLARIDGTLPLLGVLVGVTVAAFIEPGRNASRRRWAAPLVLLGALPGVLLGYLDGLRNSGAYVHDLGGQLRLLSTGLAVAGVFCLLGAILPVRTNWLPRMGRGLRYLAIGGAGLTAAALGVLISRPSWWVGHYPTDNGLITAAQEREGLAVDGTRSYAEATFQWISWYYGWPVVLVGLAGLLVWVVYGTREKRTQLLWLSALFLPSALLYLTAPSITPDHIWAMRRFLPVVVPGLLIATVWVARSLVNRGRARGGVRLAGGVVVAIALVACLVGWPLASAHRLWGETNGSGALAGVRAICEEIDGRPTVVAGASNYLATVRVLCDVPAIGIVRPTAELLADARRELGGGAFLVTHAPDTVPWDGAPPRPLEWTHTVWEPTLLRPPDSLLEEPAGVAFGVVLRDGTVRPIEP